MVLCPAVVMAGELGQLGGSGAKVAIVYDPNWAGVLTEKSEECAKEPDKCNLATLIKDDEVAKNAAKAYCESVRFEKVSKSDDKDYKKKDYDGLLDYAFCRAVTVITDANADDTVKVAAGKDLTPQAFVALAKSHEKFLVEYCGGWGVTAPLALVRVGALGSEKRVDVSAPISAGLGAGYFFARRCLTTAALGASVVAFSQGLDPSKTFQFGLSLQFTAKVYKMMNLSLGVGYDLIRIVNARDADGNEQQSYNGLFTWSHLGRPSISYMIGFSVDLGG
jgi:hypothetical protein